MVQRRRQIVGGAVLQGELAVGADAVPFGDFVADDLGNRVKVAFAGAILLIGVRMRRNSAPLRRTDSAPAVVCLARECAPAADADGAGAVVALLPHCTQGDADGVVRESVRKKCGYFRRQTVALFRGSVVQSACRRREVQARRFQRTGGADVQGGADAARGHVGLAALVDFHRGDAFRSEVAEVEGSTQPAGRRHLPAVQQHQVEVRPEAANRHPRAFAAFTVDGDARDALQGFSKVAVRKVADVLGGDCVNDPVRVPL